MRYVLAGMAGSLLTVFLLGAAPATQDVVRCRRWEVVDAQGVVRSSAWIDPETNAAYLQIGNTSRMIVEAVDPGATVVIAGPDQQQTVDLVASEHTSLVSAARIRSRE
ncbi:MAG: hypothetical protein MOGMAGMI_02483 [Candidatus Omnitrophica bacterium]|nr:hypothetical protein [Candidatus Omnitrophota bacterium]